MANALVNLKKLLFLILNIVTILAGEPDEKRHTAANSTNHYRFDQCYISDNPPLCMAVTELLNSWRSNTQNNAIPASWQLPNLFPYCPWTNQTQKHKHP